MNPVVGKRMDAWLAMLVAFAPAVAAIAPGLRAPIAVSPVRWTPGAAMASSAAPWSVSGGAVLPELQPVAWQSRVAQQYRQASETHYLPMAAAQAAAVLARTAALLLALALAALARAAAAFAHMADSHPGAIVG